MTVETAPEPVSALYCRSELTAPFGVDMPPLQDTLMFHIVTAGRCWLEVPGEPPQCLQPGDLGLVPHGRGHRLVSEPGHASVDLFDLHREPEKNWSVTALAAECGMSRSAFAARFTQLVGEPPMCYVTRWRMNVALSWLRESDASVCAWVINPRRPSAARSNARPERRPAPPDALVRAPACPIWSKPRPRCSFSP